MDRYEIKKIDLEKAMSFIHFARLQNNIFGSYPFFDDNEIFKYDLETLTNIVTYCVVSSVYMTHDTNLIKLSDCISTLQSQREHFYSIYLRHFYSNAFVYRHSKFEVVCILIEEYYTKKIIVNEIFHNGYIWSSIKEHFVKSFLIEEISNLFIKKCKLSTKDKHSKNIKFLNYFDFAFETKSKDYIKKKIGLTKLIDDFISVKESISKNMLELENLYPWPLHNNDSCYVSRPYNAKPYNTFGVYHTDYIMIEIYQNIRKKILNNYV